MSKIIIDATSVGRRMTGIEFYSQSVVKALNSKEIQSVEIIYLFSSTVPAWFQEKEGHSAVSIKSGSRFVIEQLLVPFYIMKLAPDAVYFPCFPPSALIYFLKKLKKIKVYRTVFDGVMWVLPETLSLKNKLYMRPLETFGIRYLYDHIFTISEFSKSEIVSIFNLDNQKVCNCSISFDKENYGKNEVDVNSEWLAKFGLVANEYFLYVGTLEPRKNIVFLLDVLNEIKKEGVETKLVLAGRSGWGKDEVESKVDALGLNSSVIFTGYVSKEELATLYTYASAFTFPSKYEGFGLPIVEALAMGCPVLTMNNSSLPEAAGDVAQTLEPSVNVWKEEMLKSLGKYASRKKVNEQEVIDHLNRFDWDKTVRCILEKIIKN